MDSGLENNWLKTIRDTAQGGPVDPVDGLETDL